MRHQETPTLLLPSSSSSYSVAGTRRRNRQSASLLGCPFYPKTPRMQSSDPHPVAQVSKGGARSRQPQDRVTPLPSFLFLKDWDASNIYSKSLIRARGGGSHFFLVRSWQNFLTPRNPLPSPPEAREGKGDPKIAAASPWQVSTGLTACTCQGGGWAWRAFLHPGILYTRSPTVPPSISVREGNPTYPTTEIIMAATTR